MSVPAWRERRAGQPWRRLLSVPRRVGGSTVMATRTYSQPADTPVRLTDMCGSTHSGGPVLQCKKRFGRLRGMRQVRLVWPSWVRRRSRRAWSRSLSVNPAVRADLNVARWPLGEMMVISVRSGVTCRVLFPTAIGVPWIGRRGRRAIVRGPLRGGPGRRAVGGVGRGCTGGSGGGRGGRGGGRRRAL